MKKIRIIKKFNFVNSVYKIFSNVKLIIIIKIKLRLNYKFNKLIKNLKIKSYQ